jgi:hypothetical protein
LSDLVSVRDVLARWAYTEILHAHSSAFYDGLPGIANLRQQRRRATAFEGLSESERNHLSQASCIVRRFFARYLRDVRAYRLERWKKDELLKVRVPEVMASNHPLLADYIFTACQDVDDARNAHKEANFPSSSEDPLTLGLLNSEYVLGDGFHRCNRYLVCGGADETIPVYVPIPFR